MELLQHLQQIPGPSGDEGEIADFLESHCRALPGAEVRRLGDLVIATRGRPRVAVFAHTDTVGFTLGYRRRLISIGRPYVKGGERLREVGGTRTATLKLKPQDGDLLWWLSEKDAEPGSRWVYADCLKIKQNKVSGPYLDNRAGVWNAVRVLEQAEDVAVFFTPAEEHTGRGALLGARTASLEMGITRAIVSDITWHTRSIRNGKGPAISLRDRFMPRRRFLDEVLAAAAESGVPFQREVEGSGGSDGASIERSTFPIDWVFIGAPQKRSHTPREVCCIADLHAMVKLYAYLVPALSR